MTAAFLSAAELEIAPLGSFIPAMFGGRWVRVDGGWQYRMSWYDDEGSLHRLRGGLEPTLDAIRPHELRRASTVFIQYLPTSTAWTAIPCWLAVCSKCKWHRYVETLPEIHNRANGHAQAVCRVAA